MTNRLRVLRRAMELGVSLIDTALTYGEGHSERPMGQVVRETGHKIYVATKVPPKNRLWPAQPYDYVLHHDNESLGNLNLDAIDLLQPHVWNPERFDADDWRSPFRDLGLIDTVQVIYNIFDRTPQRNLFLLCRKEHVGVLARAPQDDGALTGKIDQNTKFPPGDLREFYFKGDRAGGGACERATEGPGSERWPGESGAAVLFVGSRVSSVIPGMRSVQHAEENVGLSDLGVLAR